MGQIVQMIGNTVGSPFVARAQELQAEQTAQATAMEAAADASDLMAKGAAALANAKVSAYNYGQQAETYQEQAGGYQIQGRQSREMRGVQLGQDKGNIMASAAGSGIDASSRVVTKTLQDTSRSAYRDMEINAENEVSNANAAIRNAGIARTNAANALSIGNWESSTYSNLANQVLQNGAIAAQNELEGGYTNAKLGMYATWLGSSQGLS